MFKFPSSSSSFRLATLCDDVHLKILNRSTTNIALAYFSISAYIYLAKKQMAHFFEIYFQFFFWKIYEILFKIACHKRCCWTQSNWADTFLQMQWKVTNRDVFLQLRCMNWLRSDFQSHLRLFGFESQFTYGKNGWRLKKPANCRVQKQQ